MTHCWRRRLVFKTKSELTIYLFVIIFSKVGRGEEVGDWNRNIGIIKVFIRSHSPLQLCLRPYFLGGEFSGFIHCSQLSSWLIYCLAQWLTGWLAGWLVDWLIHWMADWFTGWLADSLVGWLIHWLVDWFTSWLTDSLAGWVIHWLADWFIGWLTD